jgi:Sec-independent protein translocase protein TatA
VKSNLLALLLLIGNWIEEFRRQVRHAQAQEERDLAEDNPNAWFDAEFGAVGRVQSPDPDAARTDQTNTDQNGDARAPVLRPGQRS